MAGRARPLVRRAWVGTAKHHAITSVTSFTDAALKKADSAEESLVAYIKQQITSVVAADR
jgi:hypothetical protein